MPEPLLDNTYFMRIALREAQMAAAEGEVPVGAVVVADGRIIARAHNLTERLQDVTAHAEILALTAAENALGAKYLPECQLFVTVEPCVMCAGAIGWAQIRSLIYGASDEKRGFTRFAPEALHPRAIVTRGVLEEECQRLMVDFFKRKR